MTSDSEKTQVVMDAKAIEKAVARIAREMAARHDDMAQVALLGIVTRGKPLADRLASHLEAATGARPKVGALGTTLYRDDLRSGRIPATSGTETHFDFDIDGLTIILVDDVLAAGRTIRAAMDEVMDYGRPLKIELACLVDRGLRELPIQPDYLGTSIETNAEDHVSVKLCELDEEDVVLLEKEQD